MKITWLGHSAFLLETGGIRIVTDPYNEKVGYKLITIPADVVTVSHEHRDHNYTASLKGNPRVIRGSGQVQYMGINFQGISSFHDEAKGSKRGENTLFVIETEGLRLCHAGDLGHELRLETVQKIKPVDILLIPVGGTYTVDAGIATKLCETLDPKIAIPMHFKTPVMINFPIATEEPFLEGKKNVKRPGSTWVEVSKESLPSEREIVVLNHAL